MAKVSLVKCTDYRQESVEPAVKRSIDLVGGIDAFVKPGMKVLLKPNLLSARLPEEGVDTHPEVVRSVARLVKAAGGDVTIGDSPGGYGKNSDEVFERSGMKRIAEEDGFRVVKFTNSKYIDGFPIATPVLESDCIISIPKLKTHCITLITVGVKNSFGMVSGLHKAECHSRAPKAEDMAKLLAKVYSLRKPHLTIVDGIVAMEGDGPAAGTLRSMNLVMASRDAVAIDACVARIIGIKPEDVLTTKEAYNMGLGEMDLSRIEVLGERLEDVSVKDYKLPKTVKVLKWMPKAFLESVMSLVKFRPVIDIKTCKRCRVCEEGCPVEAIRISADICTVDYHKCIKCLCCYELCPHKAISVKGNILTKLVWG